MGSSLIGVFHHTDTPSLTETQEIAKTETKRRVGGAFLVSILRQIVRTGADDRMNGLFPLHLSSFPTGRAQY